MPAKKKDHTHDPKPTSGWWGESERHRRAAHKNNSNGGLGATVRRVKSSAKHTLKSAGRRTRG